VKIDKNYEVTSTKGVNLALQRRVEITNHWQELVLENVQPLN